MGDADAGRLPADPVFRGFRRVRLFSGIGSPRVPGGETVTKGRYGGKPVVRALSVLAALLAVWGISRAVSAANRHQLPPPSQALSAQDERQAFAPGLAPEALRQLPPA